MRHPLTLLMLTLTLACPAWAAVPMAPAEEPEVELSPAPAGPTLYERLGGETAIRAVVDDFVARAAADPAVNFTRKGTPREWQATPENIETLKKHLVTMIIEAGKGPQKYTGRPMKEVHQGMGITSAEYDAIASDLKASMDALSVPLVEQIELLAIVSGLRSDIVES